MVGTTENTLSIKILGTPTIGGKASEIVNDTEGTVGAMQSDNNISDGGRLTILEGKSHISKSSELTDDSDVEPDKDEIALSGPVPGNPKGLLMIKKLASGKLDELVQGAPEVRAQVEQPEESEPELDSANLKSESKEKGGKKPQLDS